MGILGNTRMCPLYIRDDIKQEMKHVSIDMVNPYD